MASALVLDPEQETAARALVVLYAERVALAAAMAASDRPTGAMAQEVLDKGAELNRACETFRRKYYRGKARVAVGLYAVFATSRAGYKTTTILDLFEEYRPDDDEVYL